MIMMASIFIISSNGRAEYRHEQAVLVTDANEKSAMGFGQEDVIYKLKSTSSENQWADIEYNQVRGVVNPPRVAYLGVESQGRTSNFLYNTFAGMGDIFRSPGIDAFADILLELEDGSDFNFVRIWGYDNNASEDMAFFLFERCLPAFSGGPVTSTQLGTIDSSSASGNFSILINIAANNITVDNTACTYSLRTRFDATDASLRLYKVRAEFILSI